MFHGMRDIDSSNYYTIEICPYCGKKTADADRHPSICYSCSAKYYSKIIHEYIYKPKILGNEILQHELSIRIHPYETIIKSYECYIIKEQEFNINKYYKFNYYDYNKIRDSLFSFLNKEGINPDNFKKFIDTKLPMILTFS